MGTNAHELPMVLAVLALLGRQASEERDLHVGPLAINQAERFGQRMRNVQEVFSALKENLDQILGNLQDGILLFTGDGRAVLLARGRPRIVEEVFSQQRRPSSQVHRRQFVPPAIQQLQ